MATANQIRPGVAAQWVDPADEQKLSGDIAEQLAGLPKSITDDQTYRLAKESLVLLKKAEDKVLVFFKDIKDAAFKAHRAISTKEAEQLKPIKDARNLMARLTYEYEQRLEQERRKAEREAAEAEQRRRDAEALEQAAALADQGHAEVAELVIEQAIAAPAPVVSQPTKAVEVAGVSTRENWQPVYVGASPGQTWKDLTADQQAGVMRMLPREYCMPDESKIRGVVKAMKGGTKIPGVTPFDAGTVVVRA